MKDTGFIAHWKVKAAGSTAVNSVHRFFLLGLSFKTKTSQVILSIKTGNLIFDSYWSAWVGEVFMEDICQMHVSRVSGNGKESALAGSNTIVQRRSKGNWLVPLRSGSLHQIFKSSYCLPNQCLFLHINILTLILSLDFIQEIFGFVSRKFCIWRVLKECRTLTEHQSSSFVIPHLLLQRCFPRGETQKCSNMNTQVSGVRVQM